MLEKHDINLMFHHIQVGDEVRVTGKNSPGQYEGECNGARGLFPAEHIQFIDAAQTNDA